MTSAQNCLEQIEALAHEKSRDKRRQVLNRVADLFIITNDRQTQGDITAFGNVMDRIAYELEVEARAELSDRLSGIDNAPRQLVQRLARDDIQVARPVLERSRVLTDDDLIEIAKTRGQPFLQAISRRETLSMPVTDVMVERGESETLVEVTRNSGAEFSRSGLYTLADKAREDTTLLTALGSRSDLPADIMMEIKKRVAQRIKTEMAANQDTSPAIDDVDALVDRTAETIDLEKFKQSNATLYARVRERKITEDELVMLVRAGKLSQTVHVLSLMTGLDSRMVSHCFLRADIAALGILCKANGFSARTYLTFLQTRNGAERFGASAIARAMRDYDSLSKENALRALRFLKVRNNMSEPA